MESDRKYLQILLDSGAYTAFSKGITIDLEKYAAFVASNRGLFRAGAFNLDHIEAPSNFKQVVDPAKKSYENWCELRRLGADTIPVWHMADGPEYLEKYLDQTDYVAIGAVAKLDANSRIHGLNNIWDEYLRNKDGTARVKVHGLGLTDLGLALRYPWFSLDSTRSIMTAAYGSIFLPKFGANGDCSFKDLSQCTVSNQSREHFVGSDSFYALPKRARDQITEYCNSFGYSIDESLEGRTLKPKFKSRKRKDPIWVNGLGIEMPSDEDVSDRPDREIDQNNVSDWWVPRYDLNMLATDRFVEYWRGQGKTLRIYNVVTIGNVFETFLKVSRTQPASRCLFSYARMPDSMVARLREVMYAGKM